MSIENPVEGQSVNIPEYYYHFNNVFCPKKASQTASTPAMGLCNQSHYELYQICLSFIPFSSGHIKCTAEIQLCEDSGSSELFESSSFLYPFPIAPGHIFTIDFIFNLPSSNGNYCILIIVDHFTKSC